jgi:Zn finger protein HypA/HybF involved in hydrogenase expression
VINSKSSLKKSQAPSEDRAPRFSGALSPVGVSPVTGEILCPFCSAPIDLDFPLHECPVAQETVDVSTIRDLSPYLEQVELHSKNSKLENEYKKVSMCGKSLIKLLDTGDMSTHYKRIWCNKVYCPKCGGKNGRIHKKRKAAVLRRIGKPEKVFFRQLVFTFPGSVWDKLRSRAALNEAIREINYIVKKHFKGCGFFTNLHVAGEKDKGKGVYKPHINVDIVIGRHERYILSRELINNIRDSWQKWLMKKYDVWSESPFHYGFKNSLAKVLHEINYMTRPVGFDEIKEMDEELQEFLVLEMKNFKYLRFGGKMSNTEYSDDSIIGESEIERPKGHYVMVDIISISEFRAQYRDSELEVLGDGHYRVKPENKKKKRREKT